MNADEAEKCLEKGMEFLKLGDFSNVNLNFYIFIHFISTIKAHRMFSKSVRLTPSEKGFNLMHMCEEKMKEKNKSEGGMHSQKPHEEKKTAENNTNEGIHSNYTQIQVI